MKIVLLGDSIRLIGYGKKVEEHFLNKGYEVFQPDENCRFSKYVLRMLYDYRDQMAGADVIHFNAGLWDSCDIYGDGKTFSSLEEYEENIRRIALLLKRITPNLVFALTTPVSPKYTHNRNEDIDKFNEVALKVMNELGIRINDLSALIKSDIDQNICGDLIHLSDEGIEKASKQVIDILEEAIEEIK